MKEHVYEDEQIKVERNTEVEKEENKKEEKETE